MKISSNALTKLRSKNLRKLRTAIINRPMRLQLIICPKKELLSSFSSMKLVLIRNKCYQCKLVCTGTMNEWCTGAYLGGVIGPCPPFWVARIIIIISIEFYLLYRSIILLNIV